MKIFGKYLIFIAFLFTSFMVHGQESCNAKLKRAQKLFSSGQIEEIEQILSDCLQDGFSNEEKLEAYKMLVSIAIFEDELSKADEYMLKFLRINPEYEIKENVDPAEFIHVFNTFNTKPVASVGLVLGGNYAYGRMLKKYSVYNTPTSNIAYASPGMSIQGGFSTRFHLTENQNLSIEFVILQQKISYKNICGDNQVTFNESQTRLSVPVVYGFYKYNYKKLYPFVEGGFCTNFLSAANSEITRSYINGQLNDITGPSTSIKMQRNQYSYDLLFGAGCDYKIKKGRISVMARYFIGLTNQTNKKTRFANSEFIFKYRYIDPDFRIDRFYFSAAYYYPLYNLKKIKQ